DGLIMQLGSPREIYETPKSEFIASFIGATNIFKGKVSAKDNDRFELETKYGERIDIPKKNGMSPENITGFSIHPELISVSQDASGEKALSRDQYTILQGKVKEIFYQGEFSELTIALNDNRGDLTVHLNRAIHYDSSIEIGSDITVYWDWKHNNVLEA
ncbi:TOBE domain-containing protein, partial [Desulfobacterales bacterium]|nr:TOBE domain-containing protein [Desulfobacterales bacterium]